MELSEFGEFVETEIRKIPEYNPRIILDEWQVMPNHIHLIIELGEYNYNNGIANVDNDNVIYNGNVAGYCGNVDENGNVADGGNVDNCGNVDGCAYLEELGLVTL